MMYLKSCFRVFFLMLMGALSHLTYGQEIGISYDTVFIKKGHFVIIGDSTIKINNDTTLYLPQDSKYKVKKDKNKENDSSDFYEGFKEKSGENKFVKGLYDLMIKEQKDTTIVQQDLKTVNYHPEHEGKIVGDIEIISVDIIEGDVNNITAEAISGYAKALNKLHTDTRKAIIKKNLIVKEGDALSAYTIADNEYFLRSLKSIEDAKIYVLADSSDTNKVDLLVVVKDIFPVTIGLGVGGITDYTLGVNLVNVAGTGHEFNNSFNFNSAKDPSLGYTGEFALKNLLGSFVDASLAYRNNFREEIIVLNVKRDFITPETKYGGAIEIYNQKTSLNVKVDDTTNVEIPYTKNYADQWIGRVFMLNKIDRKSIVLKGRYMKTQFTNRPEQVESDTNQQFYNVNLLIGSITLLKKDHYKEKMLLGYGMVEDIDFGYVLEFTYGYQFSEFLNAPYFGISIKGANKYKFGYLGGGVEYGAHVLKDKLFLGLFRSQVTYYSPIFKTPLFQYRLITRFNYTEGIRRYPYEILNLGKEVRGISNKDIEGNKRLTGRFEFVTFLKGDLMGFRFSPNLFCDAAFINSGTGELSIKDFFSSIGAGVRIRNEHLAFNTIIIRIAYFTSNPMQDAHFGYGYSISVPDVIKDYKIVKPDILKY
jgi:hypothetical protein